MKGNLILSADPTSNLGAATKQYVDSSKFKLLYSNTNLNIGSDTNIQISGLSDCFLIITLVDIECPVRAVGGIYLFSNDAVTQNKFAICAKSNGSYSSSWNGISIVAFNKNTKIVSGITIADYNYQSYANILAQTVEYSANIVDYIRFYANSYSGGNYTGKLIMCGMEA